MVGPSYSPILDKLETKVRSGQFVDLADLLAENLKSQESEPLTFLDVKLVVAPSKKWLQEIKNIVTWVKAFAVSSWVLCSAQASR